jgi:hypothetical protein
MASQRTILGAAAFSLALAAGGVAGAVLGTPGLSGAQDGSSLLVMTPIPLFSGLSGGRLRSDVVNCRLPPGEDPAVESH